MTRILLIALLIGLGCSPTKHLEDPQVWRPTSDQQSDSIPGPLQNFRSFDSFSDALKAACPLILSKPNATVVHLQQIDPKLALRVSTEYCAWLYYTPEHKYELSMLTDVPAPGGALNGPRYPPSSIKYIFLLHNHPFAGELSSIDISFTMSMARAHALTVEVGGRTIPHV